MLSECRVEKAENKNVANLFVDLDGGNANLEVTNQDAQQCLEVIEVQDEQVGDEKAQRQNVENWRR